ncbi:uncharacterized protein LOC125682729 isoform X2 [Ostrea edulis]|uniref:uncharacterized protein LOC125682729 isoform X2 n=1 Tax=Ostrea edulis TaxID=37623 RepID=UPI0024AF783D|nr:uncharacterized protein LOC125682729 isoform X2 [Ostrea edulis]
MAKKRKAMQEKSQLPSTKRRRMILKQERAVVQSASEVLEGISYQSGIGHDADTDIESLPEAVPRGIFKPIHMIRGRVVPHITQMAAHELHSGASFSVYVIPSLPISSSSQQVTGIAMNGSNCMTVNGRPVEALDIHGAFDGFIKWIKSFPNEVLISHNGRRFDFPVLLKTVMDIGKTGEFFDNVCGFIDSLAVFRKIYPGRKTYKQEELVNSLLNTSYDAHNAIGDVRALGKLIEHVALSTQELLQYSFPPRAVQSAFLFREEKAKNLPTLNPLISHGVMKMCTAENVAGSGLQLTHLRKNFQRDGEDGLRSTFIAPNSEGQPRVTNVKRTLESVVPKLVDYFVKN